MRFVSSLMGSCSKRVSARFSVRFEIYSVLDYIDVVCACGQWFSCKITSESVRNECLVYMPLDLNPYITYRSDALKCHKSEGAEVSK